MKKIFALALAAIALTANAQDGYQMKIKKADGLVVIYDVDDISKVSFVAPASEMTVPAGSDIYEYYEANKTSDAANIIYLEAGGEYTQSGVIEFPLGCAGEIVGVDESARATITFTGNAGYIASSSMILMNVDIDASASSNALIALSATVDEDAYKATGSGQYYNITDGITIENADITGVNSYLIYDNAASWCLGSFNVINCVIKATTTTDSGLSSVGLIYFKGGYINDLTMQNTTLWNAGESDAKYLVQYNNSGRADRGGYSTNSVNYKNCTFYNVAKSGQWGNYSGFAGKATSVWTMTDCIFVDCGGGAVARRFVGSNLGSSTSTFANNTYWYDGAAESASSYDKSETIIESDPQLLDPANGDFTVYGRAQVAAQTGDPRWLTVDLADLPEEEADTTEGEEGTTEGESAAEGTTAAE